VHIPLLKAAQFGSDIPCAEFILIPVPEETLEPLEVVVVVVVVVVEVNIPLKFPLEDPPVVEGFVEIVVLVVFVELNINEPPLDGLIVMDELSKPVEPPIADPLLPLTVFDEVDDELDEGLEKVDPDIIIAPPAPLLNPELLPPDVEPLLVVVDADILLKVVTIVLVVFLIVKE
jgi:hypothetical protein